MELEELKNRWSSLEDQLKKQEILNEKLVQEIRQNKSGPLGGLIKYTYRGIVAGIAVIPILIYVYTHSVFLLFKTSIFLYAGLFAILAIIIGIYNIRHLKRIDFTKSVSKNIQQVQTYKINYKKQSIGLYICAIVLFLLVIIASLFSDNMEPWRWLVICAAIPLTTLFAYFEYKKIVKAKTTAILECLEKLKELEEEQE